MIEIEIYVVSLSQKYDFIVDENIMIESVIEEVVSAINQKEQQKLQGDVNELIFYVKDHKRVLNDKNSLYEQNVKSGDIIYMV